MPMDDRMRTEEQIDLPVVDRPPIDRHRHSGEYGR